MGDLRSENPGYDELLQELVDRVRTSRVRAGVAANRELIALYWHVGELILARQKQRGWGSKVIDRLAEDVQEALPGIRGFSARNLRNMRDLAREFPREPIWQQLLPNCPWGHLVELLVRVKDAAAREWYLRSILSHGWSRNVLRLQIERDLFRARGSASTNFETTLPAPQSDLAREILKDPYRLDFLGIADDEAERVIELGLVQRIRDFLLELGQGFAFVGNQVPLEVGGEQFRIDLLFYHLKLRCYVVIELKAGKFAPEHAGKLGFYLTAVDERFRAADDKPSIGMVLCKHSNDIVAEYALRGSRQPMAVAQFELTKALPEEMQDKLPSVEDLEARLNEGSTGHS